MDDIDHDKLDTALERLEAERERRLAERIEAGEVVRVPLFIVAGSEAEARTKVEEAKADALAELRADGDLREVVFDVTFVATGVVKFGEAAGEKPAPRVPSLPSPRESPAPEVIAEEQQVQADPQPVIETYVQVQVRQCQDDDDPGEIAEGWFSVDDAVVTVTNSTGKYVGSRALQGEDARVVAKRLLREKKASEEEFNRRLSYPDMGLA